LQLRHTKNDLPEICTIPIFARTEREEEEEEGEEEGEAEGGTPYKEGWVW
jgi:hypothetical protein